MRKYCGGRPPHVTMGPGHSTFDTWHHVARVGPTDVACPLFRSIHCTPSPTRKWGDLHNCYVSFIFLQSMASIIVISPSCSSINGDGNGDVAEHKRRCLQAISNMFQKFALALKAKTFEFFADDDDDEATGWQW
ncbi:hypothetical protein NL676_035771 [Syzygium grande]|nr:hypothetical protein NL676_035771 [Syzygium grande]